MEYIQKGEIPIYWDLVFYASGWFGIFYRDNAT